MRRRISATQRMWLGGLGFSVGLIVVTGLGLLSWELHSLDELRDRTGAARDDLVSADRLSTEAHLSFEKVIQPLATGVGVSDTAQLNVATSASQEAQRAWLDFKDRSLDLPGEAVLVEQVDTNLPLLAQIKTVEDVVGFQESLDQERAAYALTHEALASLDETLYTPAVMDRIDDIDRARGLARRGTLAVGSVGLIGALFVTAAGVRWRRRQDALDAAQEAIRSEESRRNELEARLQRALEMAEVEDRTYTLIGRALTEVAPASPAELLLADSSRAHFHQVLSTDPAGGAGCLVGTPRDCPAARQGQTMVYTSSRQLDACPHLEGRPGGDCSAACVPVSIAGLTVGVVHATGPDGSPPDRRTLVDVELVARKASERIGMIRAYSASQTQARTDPLTGLLNRRSLENGVRDLVEAGTDYTVVFADLDHFKQLNDVHGHDTGDRALRVFAQALRDSVRPGDVVGRFGGEEFVLVLPDCTVEAAVVVVERIQVKLAEGIGRARVPVFTSSFGLASSGIGGSYDEVLVAADQALLGAKSAGRDRMEIADGLGRRSIDDLRELRGLEGLEGLVGDAEVEIEVARAD